MRYFNKNYAWKIIFILVCIIALYFIVKDREVYPVTFYVCNGNYKDCNDVAKFKDRYDCETTSEKWGWYCDSTDKNKINCREPKPGESFATGMCK